MLVEDELLHLVLQHEAVSIRDIFAPGLEVHQAVNKRISSGIAIEELTNSGVTIRTISNKSCVHSLQEVTRLFHGVRVDDGVTRIIGGDILRIERQSVTSHGINEAAIIRCQVIRLHKPADFFAGQPLIGKEAGILSLNKLHLHVKHGLPSTDIQLVIRVREVLLGCHRALLGSHLPIIT